jgi:hypothetical protein
MAPWMVGYADPGHPGPDSRPNGAGGGEGVGAGGEQANGTRANNIQVSRLRAALVHRPGQGPRWPGGPSAPPRGPVERPRTSRRR